jgi:peptidoglycan/LPS O-acetylase OafA/YrhL
VGLSGKYAAHLLPGSPLAGYKPDWHSVIERSFWAQADLFSFGMVVAVLYTEVSDGRLTLPTHWRRIAVALGFLVFLPCAATMHQGEQSYLFQNTGEALGIALLFAAVMLPDPATPRPLRAVRFLEARPLVAVGLASYSLFLWHHPVISWLVNHNLTLSGPAGLLVNLLVVGLIAGVLSGLTYVFIELPALRRKRSTRRAAEPESSAVTTRGSGEAVAVSTAPAMPQSQA